MDVDVEPVPFEDMTLAQVIHAVLVRPMTQTELVVAMIESGYKTSMTKKSL